MPQLSSPLRTTAVLLLAASAPGCASWAPWTWKDPAKVAAERERYGATADQRVKELAAAATAAKKAGAAEQEAFAKQLAEKMVVEHDPRVRCSILEAAAGFDTPSSAALCRGGLQDPDERVRMAACSAWVTKGGAEAVQLLANRYRTDSELDVRLRALRALGELGDKEAVPVLAKALEDSDPAVQYRAVAALKKVSGRDLGNDVNRWREWAADPEGSSAEWTIAEGFRQLF